MRALMLNADDQILWKINIPDSTGYPLQAVLALAEDDDVEMDKVTQVVLVHKCPRVVVSNPKGQHLSGLPAKYQRMYEHILKGYRDAGEPLVTAKQKAAMTVRARFRDEGK